VETEGLEGSLCDLAIQQELQKSETLLLATGMLHFLSIFVKAS
jgi:hypothetical protein